jgi:hypothetical protein
MILLPATMPLLAKNRNMPLKGGLIWCRQTIEAKYFYPTQLEKTALHLGKVMILTRNYDCKIEYQNAAHGGTKRN